MLATERHINPSIDLPGITHSKNESVALILCKIILYIVLGNFCLSHYPVYINAVGFGGIIFLFFLSLSKRDYFSFLVQLFFCNHFVYGSEYGGLYNLAALGSMFTFYLLYNRNPFTNKSTFGKTSYFLFIVLIACQIIALTANNRFGVPVKLFSLIIFLAMIYLIFSLSKIEIEYTDYIRFIYVVFFFTIYMLIVSMNQRIHFTSSFFLPDYGSNAEFELDLIRSGGPFLNYEAYGEYSLSFIALLLPGILSGTIKKISFKLFLASTAIIIFSIYAIVLSGTRSSLLLLPFTILIIFFCQGKRIRIAYLLSIFLLAIGAYLLNDKFEFVDVNIFMERSASMDLEHLTLKDLISGGEMNRGEIFDYAFKKINESKGILGEGYYTQEEKYVIAHFDRVNYLPTDYHNLYLSSIVLWGVVGALVFVSIFFLAIYRGFALFFRKRHMQGLGIDLLLGFNTLFLIFMINQYKIQFIRWSNYFILIFILLILYLALMKNIAADTERK